ncbi:MAG: hypothetical protein EOM76_10345 [Sphingobacteriia bacterium]|nr:hypothetical protein [Sphingobacteriia bacterium]
MKTKMRFFMLFAAGMSAVAVVAQTATTTVGSLNIRKEVKPAILSVIPGSVQFVESTGNNAIDANETCKIRLQVKNSGTGDGYGCVANITATGETAGLRYDGNKTLPIIKVGETQTVEIPVSAGMATTNGTVNFSVQIDEPNGFGTDPQYLTVNTKAFEAPLLRVVDYTVTGANSGVLAKKQPFDLQLLLQNTQYGKAEDVKVEVTLPNGVFLTEGNVLTNYATLAAGDKKSLVYSLIVNNNYAATKIPVQVRISEKYGKYAESKTIDLQLNQTLASNKIVVDEKVQNRTEIQIASLTSDVDKNIPFSQTKNDKTFAVVIANENYQKEAKVPFALNDGKIFAEYCQKTLGLPANNVYFVQDATLNNIKAEVNRLKNIISAYNGTAKVIFYYAGHGIPDEAQKTAYLLPVDGYGTDVTTGYKLDDLYATLGNLPTKSVTVLLDACFSGAKREGDMLASARGIAIKVKAGSPQGNMVVFSAATGDQTAYPYTEKGHGMFTYFLLKKLQDTKGDVTYSDLSNYISTEVSRKSIVVNGKSQTPTVVPSLQVNDSWQTWTMK